ncbi:GNAT family N-acetyltransferase [Mammaliicoccus sciuri]|jgi:ribosomal protein S18 acetylase RimI-like enzyme|uniref:GNAT family N-acetyltransferase n=1 Tax=Mammaliicoccus sciuri TaxID=1296 RepID=UPI0008075FAF|nr:GNAT family N-acetyltransferase [Mammaliicoccus sciuri]MBF0773415.1 GNAT family N-acetyltransferase [Mammaliicoccus sciuri]MBG9205341.1 GNAT family N-acetyltransferase [Mammaliicoccus sciuri]MBO1208704.1 GNAT family N-acetyltransferase [Mammaliicoccus sciuri]MBU6088130.1 GNAT family N-acetyltransferase [Mammaliicoccus sciuri]MBW3109756.1 GNAT family N-acetyltransferase [Mammaliicoccus sciuri]
MITIERITKNNEHALKLPNELFELFGKLVVTRTADVWQYHEVLTDSDTMIFPDENYQLDSIDQKGFAIGAFDDNKCIGLGIFEKDWNQYLYLSDLKVSSSYRGQNVASTLLNAAIELAKDEGIKGIYTIAQDNNLNANRFYLKYGFEIGGLNTKSYQFTQQKGKFDIYYYLDFEA